MTDETTDRIMRGERAKVAHTEFVAPAFNVVRADYMTKAMDILAKPLNDQNRVSAEKLALAVKVLNEVEAQITALIADGKVARSDAQRSGNILRLSPEERRYASY